MKINLYAVLVLSLFLASCTGGTLPVETETRKINTGTSNTGTSNTGTSNTGTIETKIMPIQIASDVVLSSYEDRKLDTADKQFLYILDMYFFAFQVTGDSNIIKDKQGCITELFRDICSSTKGLCTINKTSAMLPTGTCESGGMYRVFYIGGIGGYQVPYIALATRVRSKELANFDGSKFITASAEDIVQTIKEKNFVAPENPANWYYIEAHSLSRAITDISNE